MERHSSDNMKRPRICKILRGVRQCALQGLERVQVEILSGKELTTPPAQDMPIQDKQAILLLNTRKMFCLNENYTHKTFSERFGFVAPSLIFTD